jgi:hypothetical protein
MQELSTTSQLSTFKFWKIFSTVYPRDMSLTFKFFLKGEGGKATTLKVPDMAVKILIFLGAIAALSLSKKILIRPGCGLWHWIRSIGNTNRMLKHDRSTEFKHSDYAVIYGAHSKGGLAFSVYLAKKGFNLILIDKDHETLD